MPRALIIFTILFFISVSSHAQFKSLLKKAEQKAVEKVLGVNADSSSAPAQTSPAAVPAPDEPETTATQAGSVETASDATPETASLPKPVVFPATGDSVQALYGVFGPVVDADVAKIAATPQGQYAFQLARQKGLKGTDVEVFQQMMDLTHQQVMEDISQEVEAKFPEGKSSANGTLEHSNPAWGGVSAPSVYFEFMVGSFDVWMNSRYVKASLRHDHATMADAFGVNAIGITDLADKISYAIGSVLGVNFTLVHPLDSGRMGDLYRTYGLVKKEYLGIPGIEIQPGTTGQYGNYHTVSEKITVPVAPYIDPETGKKSDALLALHDILSGKHDATGSDVPHYSPGYKIIYEYYFTHDLDHYLPPQVRTAGATGLSGAEGICIGAKIEDENGNSVNYRLTHVELSTVDKGEFQVPADYPVMTQVQLNEAIKKKFGLSNMLKSGLQSGSSNDAK